jgi:polyphosphate glucokinase
MTEVTRQAFGIDIGGTGIKGAIVDLTTGELTTDRERIATPQPSTPKAVAEVVTQILRDHDWSSTVGATFPAIIKNGVARSAANVDQSWIGVDVDKAFTEASGCPITVLNDADAAGLAEVRFGAAKGVSGVVLVLTFGTGIGSGLFLDGNLVPNTELGHIEVDGHDAERRAAYSAKERHDLSWAKWAERVQRYMSRLEALFSPDLFVVGGGVSKKSEKWVPLLDLQAPVRPAELLNNAGIVGAALAAAEHRGE